MRDGFAGFAYDRPVTVLMAFVAMVWLGVYSWREVPLEMMPKGFDPTFLWVQVPYPNASPTEVDEQIVQPLEDQLATIPGVSELVSRANSGSAGFQVQFHGGTLMDEAYNAVADRLERGLADIPQDVEGYFIYRFSSDDQPIMWAGIAVPDTVEDPGALLERVIRPELERVPGVASVDVYGLPQRAVYVDLDREKVYAQRVDLGSLQGRLTQDNFQMASGRLEEAGQTYALRGLSRMDGVEALKEFPVSEGVDLDDIASVSVRDAMSASIRRIDGQEAAFLSILKESSANTLEVSERVDAALARMEVDPRMKGVSFTTFFSQGELIRESLDALLQTAWTGGVMAVFVLWVFLREWRMTLLIAGCIPFCILMTVAVLSASGGTLNLVSLLGLMLAVGMVVDNAIVVVESIYTRRVSGVARREAAVSGVGEVGLAIMASTATSMVVFLPMLLMSDDGMVRFFMGELGLPVVYALTGSLLTALFVLPLATRYLGDAQIKADPRWLTWLTDRYAKGLRWVLTYRMDAAMWGLVIVALTVGVAFPNVEWAEFEEGDFNDFAIRFSVPPQSTYGERLALVQSFEEIVEEHKEEWGVRVYRASLDSGQTRGTLDVYLENGGPMPRDEVIEQARELLPRDTPGVMATIGWNRQGAGDSPRLAVTGPDMKVLEEIAAEVIRRAKEVDGVLDAELEDGVEGRDEIQLTIDRAAADRLGMTAAGVGQLVAYSLRGSRLPDLRVGESDLPVQLRFSPEDRESIDAVLDFEAFSAASMSLVPIRTMTNLNFERGPRRIRRVSGKTSTSVVIDTDRDQNKQRMYAKLNTAMDGMALPAGYEISPGRDMDMQMEDRSTTMYALLLSMCFVFLLMGALFESYLFPLAVISTVPMAMAGSAWGLFLSRTPMDTMAGVGLVILVGVVVNNGIVLVDLVTQLRGEGMERMDALVEAGRRRIRPILMTALTTIFGLIPMAVGSSRLVGVPYAPLGRTVIAGLCAATVLTLLFVPYLYARLDDLGDTTQAWWKAVRRTS